MVSPLLSPLAPKQDEFPQILVASDDDRKSRNFPTSRLEGSAVARMMDGLHKGSGKQQDTDIFAGSSLSESVSPSPGQRQTEAIAETRNQEKMPRRSRQLQPSPLNLLDDGFEAPVVSEAPDATKRRSLGAEPHRNGSQVNGHSASHHRSPSQRTTNGDQKNAQYSLPPDQAFGMVFEHSQGPGGVNGNTPHRTSLVDVIDGPEVATVLNQWSGEVSPVRNQDTDRERVPKLSPAKIEELTSSPQSIPYRAADSEHSRRVVSDQTHASNSQTTSTDEASPLLNDIKFPPDHATKSRTNKEFTLDGGLARPPTSSTRHRSQSSRAVSTPTSARRQTLPSNERLAQTWASRSKHDRPSIGRGSESKHLNPAPEMSDSTLPSPMPPSIPLPPLSIPTYLQLELASGRPSPLYIHPSASSDFPYESSRVKLERLMNFFMLPPVLEQVFWFGILACLDSWLYSFTILPLRFVKALYILLESWMVNLGVEFRFLSGFIIKGVGRVWRRRNKISGDGTDEQHLVSEAEGRSRQESAGTERDVKTKAAEARRRCRSDTHHKYQHRRQKSIPSTLLPDDKADILKGLLMIATCAVLMYFDASRMYHWIRGQAAIKLYVIYNVLEVSDRLFAAIGQDVLECLFSREALERRPNGRSKVFRPFGLFLLALAYTVVHATALFYQVMTLNVAVNSYSNALLSLLLSNQFVEIKSTVFKKFEKENLFQLTCADVVERFQLWLMLTIIASRNIVETGAFNFIGNLGSSFTSQSTSTNSTPLSTPPRTMSSILPQSFTIVPSSIIASFSHVNSFLPTLAQVLGPFLVVLGSEMLVDWLKHAYIGKFNNTRPVIYKRFLDILTKDYYTNAFGDQNLTRRLGLPVIPLSCLFFRVSVQTYQMFLAALLPQHPSSTAVESTSLSSIYSHYVPAPIPSPPPLTLRTIVPASAAHMNAFFQQLLANTMPSPAQSVYIFTVVLILTGYVVLLIVKLLLGMVLLAYARSRYRAMKQRETEQSSHENSGPPRAREYAVEGSRRFGGWGVVEVNDDHRRWIYTDDPEGLRRLKAKEEKEKNSKEELNMDHVRRYEMVAKRIW
ncbi:cytomegalovirus gH-receptor family protein [Aspergillus flavus]|nr:cytomegalovirus gH-receptor family protein [Aspergillus flavus]